MTSSKIIHLPVIRIERDKDGAWLAIRRNGHAWSFGSRAEALNEKRWLEANARAPPGT